VATFFLKKDNLKLGLVLGLLGQMLGLVTVFYFSGNLRSLNLVEFLDFFFNEKRLITSN
jgi:hypothetical protein